MKAPSSNASPDQQTFPSTSELLKTGPTLWFGGDSSFAEDEQIALTSNGFRLTFNKKDVLESQRIGKHYVVCVPVDANMVIEMRRVAKAGGGGCGCTSGTPSASRDWFGGNYDVGFFEAGGCWIKIECKVFEGRRICFVTGIICPTNETAEN